MFAHRIGETLIVKLYSCFGGLPHSQLLDKVYHILPQGLKLQNIDFQKVHLEAC